MFKRCDITQDDIESLIRAIINEHFNDVQNMLPGLLVSVVSEREAGYLGEAESLLTQVNSKLITLNETLNRHLQVATLRFGLENSDRGAFDSLKIGLNHMCKRAANKEYDGLRRKIKSLLLEFEVLEGKAFIDDIINQLMLSTGTSNPIGDKVPRGIR